MLASEANVLRNRRPSGQTRSSNAWIIEHGEEDACEPVAAGASEKPEAALAGMLERLLVPTVIKLAGGVFRQAFVANRTLEQLAEIRKSNAPWDQQLLQAARLSASFDEWLPPSIGPRMKGMMQSLEDAVHLWQASRRVLAALQALDDPRRPWMQRAEDCIDVLDLHAHRLPSAVQRRLGTLRRVVQYGKAVRELRRLLQSTPEQVLHEAGGSRLGLDAVCDELAGQLPPVLARRLNARREGSDALTFCRTETERAYLAFEQVSQSRSWQEIFAAVGGWLESNASDDVDALTTIKQQLDAFRVGYDKVCAILSDSTNFELRLICLADYIARVDDRVLRAFLAERFHPAIDALTGVLRTGAAASEFFRAFSAIYRNDLPWQGKLQALRCLMEEFACSGLAGCPVSVQEVFKRLTEVMDVVAELASPTQASGLREVTGRVASVVHRIERLLPALESSLPDGAMAQVDGIVRAVGWLTRQIQTLTELPGDATLSDYLGRAFREGDAPPWLPPFMEPLSALGRQLGDVLRASEDAHCPAFPRAGPLSEQLNWIFTALQSDRLTDSALKLLPARLTPVVSLSRALLLRVNAFPAEASVVERASWLVSELSGPDVRALLNAPEFLRAGLLGEIIADEDFQKWLDILHRIMKGGSQARWSGGLMAAMREHWRTIGSALSSVALCYVPGGPFIKQVSSWVHRVRPQEDWMATADDFIRIVASDINEDVSSGRFAMLRLLPGATAEGLGHAAMAVRHFSLYSEQWDWTALLQDYCKDSAQRSLFDAFLLVRLTWSLHRLATSEPPGRDASLRSLQRDVEHLRLLGWRGMTSLAQLLPLVPDLCAVRARIHVEPSKARNWFDWAAAVCGALADDDTPSIRRLRQKLEEGTEALLANALQQTLASLSGEVFVEPSAGNDDAMRLSVIPPQLAQRCAIAGEEDQDGFVMSGAHRYVVDDGRLFLVHWDSDERAYAVVSGERVNDRAAGPPLVRVMGRWWVRPRLAKLPGGGLLSRWFSTTLTANPTAAPLPTEAADAVLDINADHHDSPDAFISNNLEYWTEDGQIRLRDFVIASGERAQSGGRLGWAVGLSGAFLLLLTSVYVWRAFRRGAVPEPSRRANDGSASGQAESEALVMEGAPASERVEGVGKQTAVDIEQPMLDPEPIPDAVPDAVRDEHAGWRPTRGELTALAVLGSASLGMIGWASFSAWQSRRPEALVAPDDLDAGRLLTERDFEIVVDAPFAMQAVELAGRGRRSAPPARGKSSIPPWPLPRNAKIDPDLSAEVSLRFDAKDSYMPRRGDFGAMHMDGVYWDAAGVRAYLFVSGRYWPYTYDGKQGAYHEATIHPVNKPETFLDIRRLDGGAWFLALGATFAQAAVVPPGTSRLGKDVGATLRRWDAEESFKYAEQAAGWEGQVYTDWDGTYLYANGSFWPAVVLHENLLRVTQEKQTAGPFLYLKREEPGSLWRFARVVKPEHLPAKLAFSPDLVARAQATLAGEPWTSAWVADEPPGMYRKAGSEAKYLRIDDSLYRCSEVGTERVNYFPEEILTLVWRLDVDLATATSAPLLAGQDTSGAWHSILNNGVDGYWAEERVGASRALGLLLAAASAAPQTPDLSQLAPVSPGLYAMLDWGRYLRVGGRLHRCWRVDLDPRAFADGAPETVMRVADSNIAGYVAGRGWGLFSTGASGKLELVRDKEDIASGFGALPSVSGELTRIIDTFDTAHALHHDGVGMGREGVVYAESGQLSISVNGRYWLFMLLSPQMGIIFGDSSGRASCVVIISDGQWQLYGGSVASLGLQDLLEVGTFHGFSASLEVAVGGIGPHTWSQTIELLDNAADHAFHGSYLKPASGEFRRALGLKYQVAYLKSISDSSGSLRTTVPAPDMSKLKQTWDAETIKRYWPLFQADQDALSDPDFTESCAVRGLTPEQVSEQAERLRVAKADLAAQKKTVDAQFGSAEWEETMAAIGIEMAIGSIMRATAVNNWNKKKVTRIYWQKEQARVNALHDEIEKLVLDQDALTDLYSENRFVEGVALGFERERVALEALKSQPPTGRHWRYGLMYSDLIAELTYEMILEFSQNSESEQLHVIDAARLYLQQQFSSMDEYAALIGKLSSVPSGQRTFTWRGDYRDIVAAQELADKLINTCMKDVEDEERAEGTRAIAATLYHLVKTGDEPASIDVMLVGAILDEFEAASRKFNPLYVPKRPEEFFSLSQIKPNTLTNGDAAYYQQFVEYEKSGSLDYEAAWIANFTLLKVPLQIDDFYSIRQSYFVDNAVEGTSDLLIKLKSGKWMLTRYHGDGLGDPRDTCELQTYEEMAMLPYWYELPYIGDGYGCSASWAVWDIGIDIPENQLEAGSAVPLRAETGLVPELVRLTRKHLVTLKQGLKASFYAPELWQLYASLVPFWDTGHGLALDPEHSVRVEQVLSDVMAVAIAVIPWGAGMVSAGAKVGFEKVVLQGLRYGLRGRGLYNYVALKVSPTLPEFFRTSFLLLTRMLIEAFSPVPLPTFSSSFRVKPVKWSNVAGPGNLAFVRNPGALVPAAANSLAFTPLSDAFQLSLKQVPAGEYLRADLRGNRLGADLAAGPSRGQLAPDADVGLSIVREQIDQVAPWKYVMKSGGKKYGFVFDQKLKQFRLVYPDDWTRPGPLVSYTADGWRQAPMLGAARDASESKAILLTERGLSQVRARVLRGNVRAGRKSARESLTVGLKVLRDPAERASVDRLLDMFMGQHSPALKTELESRMQNSLAALRRLRSSKDVFYRIKDEEVSASVMSVPAGEGYTAPQVVRISWYGKRTTSSAIDFGERQPYMMNVYSDGVQLLQDHHHQAYPQAFARTMLHESFHMVNDTHIDMYVQTGSRGYHLERLVSNAAGFLRTSDAAGNMVDLPLDQVATLPKYDGMVRWMLPYAAESFAPFAVTYKFKDAGGRLDVARVQEAYGDKSEVEDVLRHVRDSISPAMKDNPDSYSFVVLGLEKIRKRPVDFRNLLDDLDYVLEHGPSRENALIWPW
ncbi:hypothetical protein QCE62_22855 [Caballeronia sp. LZ033]|uniref:hypothetical protein n=1 Tax=Caballeronia sp. LZ033 TaxID=3038566 RepID=UPI00285963C3|nr:hypothetical protein [Caballeronia sp. LZ033]MDR5816435.1 hypothetical protein [Caballeronia sp. LZ033]